MAQESCNLDKEDAEILKPSSPSSKLSPLAHKEEAEIIKSPLPSLFMNSAIQEFSAKKSKKSEKTIDNSNPKPTIQLVNRCMSCRKKVGLTGFRCRCGQMFCGQHRYSDAHDCSFDYKAFGRERISKENPVVRASKIMKI